MNRHKPSGYKYGPSSHTGAAPHTREPAADPRWLPTQEDSAAGVKFVRVSELERGWWTGDGHCLGPTVVGRPGSEVTDERGSTAEESECMGDSNSAARFSFEFESRSSFRRLSPDMGKSGRQGSGNKKGNKTKLAWREIRKCAKRRGTKLREPIRAEWSECGSDGLKSASVCYRRDTYLARSTVMFFFCWI